MTTRKWISSPRRWLIAAACLLVAAAGAMAYRYASVRVAAIAAIENAGGSIIFAEPAPLPKWFPIPQWLRSIEGVRISGVTGKIKPRHIDCRHFETLRELTWIAGRGDEIDDQEFRRICRLPNLQQISIRSDRITDAGMDGVRDCRHLTHIRFPNSSVSDKGLETLSSSHVIYIDASRAHITDRGLEHLAGLPLAVLDVSGSSITDAGLAHLEDMPLHILNLDDTEITDAGLNALTSLPLEEVRLWHTRVTRDGLLVLAPITTLREVRLSIPPFTSKDAEALNRAGVPAIVGQDEL